MYRSSILFSLFLMAFALPSFAQSGADQILGQWTNEDHSSRFEIYKEGGKYFAKVIWLAEPNAPDGRPKTDQRNADLNLRTRPILGLVIISDLTYQRGKWSDGAIYSPLEGQTVDSTLTLMDDGKLKVTGSKYFFSASKTWTRL